MRGSLVLEEILQTTVNQLHEALKVSRCLIFRPDSENHLVIHHVSETTKEGESLLGIQCDFYNHYHSQLAKGSALVLPRIEQSLGSDIEKLAQKCSIKSIAIMPLIYKQSYIGGISLHECDREREWTADEMVFLKAIADHCAIAIHQAELYQRVQNELRERQKAEQALRMSEQLFRQLAENIHQAFFVRDPQQDKILYLSPAHAEICGVKSEVFYEQPRAFLNIIHPEDRQRINTCMAEEVNAPLFNEEYRIIRPDGEIRWVCTSAFPLRNDRGEVYRITGIIEDITERKQAELALKEQQQFLRTVIDTNPNLIFVKDRDSKFTLVNQACADIYNTTPEEMIGKTDDELNLVRAETDQFQRDDLEVMTTWQTKFIPQEPITTATGEIRWLQTIKKPLFSPDGKVRQVLGVATDITERVQAEKKLEERERVFCAIFNNTFQFTGLLTPDGILLEANQTVLDFAGLQTSDVIGKPLWSAGWWTKSKETQKRLQKAIATAARGQFVRYEEDVLGVGDTIATIDFSLKPVFDQNNQVVMLIPEGRNITELKQAKLERDRFFNYSTDLMVLFNLQGEFQLVNPAWEKTFNYSQSELQGKHYSQFIHPDDLEISDSIIPKKVVKSITIIGGENRYMCQDGTYKWVSWNCVPFPKENVIYAFGRDITEQKQAEAALRESEARFRALSECSPVGIFMADIEGFSTYTNPRCQAICGFSFTEGLEYGWLNFVHPEERQWVATNFSNYTINRRESFCEYRFLHKDGTIHWVQVRTAPLFLAENQLIGFVGTIEDITESKQAQEQLQSSLQEKEILLKEVHHRVKNNLQIIYSLLDLQSQQIQDSHTLEMFHASKNRIKSMALIHERLYQSENMARINFADYINTLANYLQQAYAIAPYQITLKLDLEPILLNIDTAIPCGLIINELVGNAFKHAFPENTKGTILIQLKSLNGRINLQIQDNGFSSCNLSSSGQNTLGIKLVKILVKQLEGEIEIEQTQGTTFKIQFSELEY